MPQCKAKSKRSGERCKNKAMKGKTICRMHGGKSSGAPTGSKNALKTGEHETITPETMFQDEIVYANTVSLEPVYTLEEELKILKVRELRMLRRIKKLLESEYLLGKKIIGEGGKKGEVYPHMVTVGGTRVKTKNFEGDESSIVSVQSESHSQSYLKLEQALTSIQEQIGKTVERLVKLKAVIGDDADNENTIIEFRMIDGRTVHGE